MFNLFNLFISRLDGERITDSHYRHYIEKLVEDGIGGFIVFGGQYDTVKNFISYLQRLSKTPLIIASDIERGVGCQIEGATLIPSQMGIAAGFDLIKDREELESLYSIVIKEAKDIGINLALIPVLDVNTEPENPIICTRAFSDDCQVVSKYGGFLVKFFESRGVLTCGKHFPGHGGTALDSHITLPTLRGSLDIHLKPFIEAIKKRVSTIMVGHLLYPQCDSLPATLSEKMINDLLRQKLGFKGAVLTDAMNMKALSEYKSSHTLALKAGADIILHPQEPYLALDEIKTSLNKKLIDESRIKEALKRINRLRKKIELNHKKSRDSMENDNSLIQRAFKKTVTVVKNEIDDLKAVKIIPYLTGFYTDEIKQAFENYFGFACDLMEYKKTTATVLIAAFTNIKAGAQAHELKESQKSVIERAISETDAIFVSFGNPYVVRHFKKAKTIIVVYDSHEQAVRAFLDAFREGFKTSGRLPIKI